MMRPCVGVDVDDVLADFTGALLNLLATRYGHCFQRSDISSWDVFDSLPEDVRAVREEVFDFMRQPGECARMPVCPGAQPGMKLLETVADVIIVTSPWRGGTTWAHEREEWLEKHFGRYDIYSCRNKARVRCDFFIDDKPENVRAWMTHNETINGILWATPMNRFASPYFRRTCYWEEVTELVRKNL